MGKFHKRVYYEMLLERLMKESGEAVMETFERISDYNLMLQINAYLKRLHLITYTPNELNDISVDMD